ncbi:hypothetical protein [Paraburkholderia hospita]|uniref:hypothetical protein n=1 Tax=Paraburkholderia hospita TaxID=169430 RepID=UPI000B342D2E|nr:hypothetical protein [Paraburkholderia hospita]OUL79608.1 hypothetical protein CA603_33250 [Paraburkholderia hospita]
MKNAITTPREFFERVVTPDVAALNSDIDDVRLAFHAAISLHQLSEWVWGAHPVPFRNAAEYLKSLYPRHLGLEMVRALAFNAKHFPPEWVPTLQTGYSLGPALSLPNAPSGESTHQQVLAKDELGESIWVVPIILDAYDFWVEELKRS